MQLCEYLTAMFCGISLSLSYFDHYPHDIENKSLIHPFSFSIKKEEKWKKVVVVQLWTCIPSSNWHLKFTTKVAKQFYSNVKWFTIISPQGNCITSELDICSYVKLRLIPLSHFCASASLLRFRVVQNASVHNILSPHRTTYINL